MNTIQEILRYIMSGVEIVPFIGNYIVAIGAILFRFTAGVAARDRLSNHTPVKFNLRFFIADNGARIVTYFLGLFFVLLFCSDIIGAKASLYVGFVIGLFIEDIVYKVLSSRPEMLNTFFNRGKQKYMEYVFLIPAGAEGIKINGNTLTISEAAQVLSATVSDNNFVIQEAKPDELEFIVGGVSSFVGHVPRPK